MSPKEYDRLNKHRTSDRDEARDFENQREGLDETRAEQKHLNAHMRLLEECPARYRAWLQRVIRNAHSHWMEARFLREVERVGLVRAALCNIDQDDADAKEVRRGAENCLPADKAMAFTFL